MSYFQFTHPLLAGNCSLCTSPGLKGQYNSAQGIVEGGTNRNAALGIGFKRKTVREDSMNKVKNSFRTELQNIISGKQKVISLVRNKILSFVNICVRTIFNTHSTTQGDTSFALG